MRVRTLCDACLRSGNSYVGVLGPAQLAQAVLATTDRALRVAVTVALSQALDPVAGRVLWQTQSQVKNLALRRALDQAVDRVTRKALDR